MAKIQFIGRVLPATVNLTLPATDVHFGPTQGPGLSGVYRIRIANSIINIVCEAEGMTRPDLYMILGNALGLSRVAVNLASFATAQPMQVTFDAIIDDNGMPSPFILQHSTFRGLNTAVSTDNGNAFNELCHEIMRASPPYAYEVLNDLRTAISEPVFSILHVNRVVEGIKQDISGAIKDDKTAWKIMRDALNIDEKYLRQITDLSKGPRHARVDTIHGKDALEAARRAWIITNRYLEYIKRKRVSLSITEFPMLQEQP